MPKQQRHTRKAQKSHPIIKKHAGTNDSLVRKINVLPLPSCLDDFELFDDEGFEAFNQNEDTSLEQCPNIESSLELEDLDLSEFDVPPSSDLTFDPRVFDEEQSKKVSITPTNAMAKIERLTISPTLKSDDVKPIAKIDPQARLTITFSAAQWSRSFFGKPQTAQLKNASNAEIISAIKTLASRKEIAQQFGVTYSALSKRLNKEGINFYQIQEEAQRHLEAVDILSPKA